MHCQLVLRRRLVQPFWPVIGLQRHQFPLSSVCFGRPYNLVITPQPALSDPARTTQHHGNKKRVPNVNQTKDVFKFPATATAGS
jgi:hypothetical protein